MTLRRAGLLLLLLCCAPAAEPSSAGGDVHPGMPCPVRPEREAVPEHRLAWQGRVLHFCCADCVSEFAADPQAHAAQLPGPPPTPGWRERLPAMVEGSFLVLLGSGVALLLAAAALRGWRPTLTGSPLYRMALVPLPVVAALAWELHALDTAHRAALAAAAAHSARADRQEARTQAAESLNHHTFQAFGNPPVPRRRSGPPQVAARYYRGNDERSPRLFNGGNYRTCVFALALLDGEGRPLAHGGRAAGGIVLELAIERSPFTSDAFWTPQLVDAIMLTRSAAGLDLRDPPDRVPLEVVEPQWRYRARFALGRVVGAGDERLAGIVYLAERMTVSGHRGRRLHAAIQHDLRFVDGALAPESGLWMDALYHPTTAEVLPPGEWFSAEPIPELPAPHTTRDPRLLGLPATPEAARN